MDNKILVVFTGGTIGSGATDGNISPDRNAKYVLLQKYQQITGEDLSRFETCEPMYILSENAVLDDVQQMVKVIKERQNDGFKGIILTHGTDTLAYSCAYLGLMLNDVKVPVVMVSSNLTLSEPKANGVANFIGAVKLIDANVRPNVYVSYRNPGDNFTSIHLGTRIGIPPHYSDSFYSPEGKRFAVIKNGVITPENIRVEKCRQIFPISGKFTKKCLYIEPFTGLDYNVYNNSQFDYVLHSLYHSGTANTRKNENYNQNSLLAFAEYCKNNNKPLYLCNIKKKDINYDSTNKLKKQGVEFIYDVLPNVALAKINIAYNLIDEKLIDDYLKSNINGEVLQGDWSKDPLCDDEIKR